MVKKVSAKLPDGWVPCNGTYLAHREAVRYAEIWNNRNDGYYYKVFPKYEESFVIAKRLRSELKGE